MVSLLTYTMEGTVFIVCSLEEVQYHIAKKFFAYCRKIIVRERSFECSQVRGEARILMCGYLILLYYMHSFFRDNVTEAFEWFEHLWFYFLTEISKLISFKAKFPLAFA